MSLFTDLYNQILKEKAEAKINGQWHVCTLDNGDELSTNLLLLSKDKIQIGKKGERTSYEVSIAGDPIKIIQKELGYKLNLKDAKVADFISLLPCPCEHKGN